jgi:broad specificity phosphatase PhoE
VNGTPPAEILLVRHGETEWSRDGKHTGGTDLPLTGEGRRQAERLGAELEGRPFARVITSPLQRAVETCRLAGLADGAERRDALLEWDYGDYEGRTTPEIREERPGWFLWRDGCPGGESAAQVGARVDPLIGELRELRGDAALFAHGHVLRVLAARWLGLPPESGALFALSTATVSIIGWEREIPVIRLWNASAL